MRISQRVRIAGITYRVRLDENLSSRNLFGYHDPSELCLSIDPQFGEQRRESTFLHEVIEAINHCYDMGLKHHQIELLETALYQFLVDNPEVFEPCSTSPASNP